MDAASCRPVSRGTSIGYSRLGSRRSSSTPNLTADRVLLLIERLLLALCDMAVVELRHCALFLANGVIFAVKLVGLLLCDLAFFQFFIDTVILVR